MGKEFHRRAIGFRGGFAMRTSTASTGDVLIRDRLWQLSGSSSTSVYLIENPQPGHFYYLTCIDAASSAQANVRPQNAGITFYTTGGSTAGREIVFADPGDSCLLAALTTSAYMPLLLQGVAVGAT